MPVGYPDCFAMEAFADKAVERVLEVLEKEFHIHPPKTVEELDKELGKSNHMNLNGWIYRHNAENRVNIDTVKTAVKKLVYDDQMNSA